MATTLITEQDEFLYLQVAERLHEQIEKGLLKTGEKLVSVRALSREQGISISTAFKAYSYLEMKGLVEARPKSGYYVKFTPREYPQLPTEKHQDSQPDPQRVSACDMLSMVYENLDEEGIIRLSLAAPGLELLPQAKLSKTLAEALRQSAHSCMNYEHIQGNKRLRTQIAKYAFNWGGRVADDDIVTTQGCMEALFFCLKAVTQPGDTVAIESPTYFGILNVMQSLGLKVLELPTHPETGIDLPYLEQAIEQVQVKACLFVTNFINPLGACMPDENKKQLVTLLAQHQIPLIEDDIYGELYFGRTRPRTCKSYDKEGLVLLCSSVSKSLAPGYRVGWCLPGRFKERLLNIKMMHTVSSATPTQAAIGLFFENGRYDLHLRKLRKALHTQCLRYIQAIAEYFPADTKVSRPSGGYVLWVEMNKAVNAFELFQQAMHQKISIAPGQIFSTDARYTNFMRISFGMPYTPEIDKGMKVLGSLVEQQYKD
ncbi:PLP-dependent aminotransferase family protein [Cesiribacter sp. SM1]|uniref:aminotransferase-like domain-containing protein n=1 Tax=Cesiribacter sp. SM1 TaxID=2861196 RepID=UPI001CD1FAC8|nr:PLP-dependent aminotransferase family protein [Cesiribacter sp. SM1]